LAERIGIGRNTLVEYFGHLGDAALLSLLYRDAMGVSRLSKPDKVYLENPNLGVLLGGESASIGALRETFLLGQLSAAGHRVEYPETGDFRVDGKWLIEVGGTRKGKRQLGAVPNGIVAVDGIEIGSSPRIPLWLFGFLS
jgi:predicted AAA+ superfamily ATPase